eukprot:15346451-Alexandrium_andersonii.AAC.1
MEHPFLNEGRAFAIEMGCQITGDGFREGAISRPSPTLFRSALLWSILLSRPSATGLRNAPETEPSRPADRKKER